MASLKAGQSAKLTEAEILILFKEASQAKSESSAPLTPLRPALAMAVPPYELSFGEILQKAPLYEQSVYHLLMLSDGATS